MTISPFGWHDNNPPDINSVNLELDRTQIAAYGEAFAEAAIGAEQTRAEGAEALKLAKASNLSDVADVAAARTNLGLGTAATQASGAFDAAGAAAAAAAASVPLTQKGAATGVATLDSESRLPLAQLPATKNIGRWVLPESPGAGIDGASLISDAYRAGGRHIVLDGDEPWLIDSPVFFDETLGLVEGQPLDQIITLEINSTGGLKLGPNLPSTSAFTPDAATKWAFFPGTKRSAFNAEANTVTCNDLTSATGGHEQAQPGLIITGGLITGPNTNTGLIFGNQMSSRIEKCTAKALKFGISWRGYTDNNGLDGCTLHSSAAAAESGAVAGAWLMYQITNGDGVRISSVETAGQCGIWNAKYCRGGVVEGYVAGALSFTHCSGIELIAGHVEMTEAGNIVPSVFSNCSQINLRGGQWFAGVESGRYPVEINDESGAIGDGSVIKLDGCTSILQTATNDPTRTADIFIAGANPNTRLIVLDSYGRFVPQSSGINALTAPLIVKSSVNAITTALTLASYPFQKSITATRSWVLSQSVGTWSLHMGSPLSGMRSFPAQAAPSSPSATAAVAGNSGTLAEGQLYEYAFSTVDDNGITAPGASTAVSATASATRAIQLKATIAGAPIGLVIWRKKGTGALTEPDAYAILPHATTQANLYDSGNRIAGVNWVTTSIPVPAGTFAYTPAQAYTEFVDGSHMAVGPWVPLTLNSKLESAGKQVPSARREGERIFFRGAIKAKEKLEANETFATLPEGQRPATGGVDIFVGETAHTLRITATGVMTLLQELGAAKTLLLDDVSFNLT